MERDFLVDAVSPIEKILKDIKKTIEAKDAVSKVSSVAYEYGLENDGLVNLSNKSDYELFSNGGNVVTVDEAMNDLARQIGLNEENTYQENSNNMEAILNEITHLDLDESSPKAKKSPTYVDSHCTPEDLIVSAAMEEVNNRLRKVIAKWVEDNLPSMIRTIIYEEMTKFLKDFKF